MDYNPTMQTIAELPEYIRSADKLPSTGSSPTLETVLGFTPPSANPFLRPRDARPLAERSLNHNHPSNLVCPFP